MRRHALAFAVVLLAAAPAMARDAADRTFQPDRVGAIVKGATKPVDLAKIYGAGNVRLVTIGFEGGQAPGARLFEGTPDALEVTFSDDGQQIASVSIGGKNWKSTAGLRVGMSVADLERLNRGPFKFQGFGADEAGRVYAEGASLKPFGVYIGFDEKAPELLRREAVFSSRHPALKGVRTEVIFIVVAF